MSLLALVTQALVLQATGLVLGTVPAWRLQRVPLAQAMQDY